MRRIAALALGLLALSCAGSKKELARIEDRLAAMEAEQQRMRAAIDSVAAEQRQLAADLDQFEIERSQADDPAERVADLQEKPDKPRPGQPDPAVRYRVLVEDAHVRGPETALVTIVEWADFQCPFCGKVKGTLDEIEKKYQGQVRFVFKHNPLPMHQRALPAAIAAEAAGRQGKFWPMHDLLFADMRKLDDEQFKAYAKKLKLDKRRFKRDLADGQLKAKIDKQQQQGASLGARGTPAFFINGRFLSGAQPIESFTALIDEEMEVARKRLEPGLRGVDVYEQLMNEALPPPF